MGTNGRTEAGAQLRRRAWFDSEKFRQAYHYDGELGAKADAGGTSFALWAPTAQRVTLRLYRQGSGGEPISTHSLAMSDRGVWRIAFPQNLHGVYYDYAVTCDGVTRVSGDPYARACGVNGVRSMAVELARTNPEGWEEDAAPPQPPENVIYELHVKDFTWDAASGVPQEHRGRYSALTLSGTTLRGEGSIPTGVDHILHLGATHVQLMPVYDYGSVDEASREDPFNWGYDPVNYNVPEGSYASDPFRGEVRIRELKQAVMALHSRGLRVVMDVVYNHTYHLDSPLFAAVPWYYYRQDEAGKASNGSGCGTEIASERSMCARYIIDSVLYWAEEYHIDGFRFDLMGMLDTELMTQIRRELDQRYGVGEKLVYGEPWAGGTCHPRPGTVLSHKGSLKLLPEGVGAFCDNTRDAVKGSVMQAESRGMVNGGGLDAETLGRCITAWAGEQGDFGAPSQTISYLSCHDDWTLWDKLVHSMDPAKNFVAGSDAVLRANKLAAAILMCCQGHLFLLSGEEAGRTKLGVKNSYASPVALNRVDWTRLEQLADLAAYYRGLIALRKTLPGLCDKSSRAPERLKRCEQLTPHCTLVEVGNRGGDSPYSRIALVVNVGDAPVKLTLQGTWHVLADADSSLRWQQHEAAAEQLELPGMAALVLGRVKVTNV